MNQPIDKAVHSTSHPIAKAVEEIQQQIVEQARAHYSETVIDHWLNPRNVGTMEHPDGHARVQGPCGDSMQFFLRVRDDVITEASFLTDGCVTTLVSASMAIELATGKTIPQASAISQALILERLGGLPEESQHCALLAANTLGAAVKDYLATRDHPWKRAYRPT